MNDTITPNLIRDLFVMDLPFFEVKFSTDVFFKELTPLLDRHLSQSFDSLEAKLGSDILSPLSFADKMHLLQVLNSIDFGHPINLDRMAETIANYELE